MSSVRESLRHWRAIVFKTRRVCRLREVEYVCSFKAGERGGGGRGGLKARELVDFKPGY